ncbi:MAG TPA: sigma-70 family RNA polymerase sigma factor, partial [Verrucomicrobiae bacterium]|nr:sigma-70 family RNA polymerase sigma factor [Verrucomicrobiae bacterium]
RICSGDTHLAEDITQTVFADLARKAARLPGDIVLSAWLYRHTFFVASSMIRTERRRRAREQEAVAMNATHETAEPDWALLAPHLDEAMNALVEADRRALVLRYFDKLDLRAVGERLGVSEDTAQKRVARALERLKTRFAKKGVSVSLTALAASLLAHAVSAAPAVLAAQTASAVVAGFVAGSGILIALEKFMTLNALKPIAAALAVAGVATPLFLQHQSLAAARDQNASLGAQVAELDELRAENERLAKLAVDYRELERLRAEHLELMRLRGEATLMRNELDALKREFERHRQLLLAKGVSEDELLTEAEHQARRQIVIEPRFAELPLSSTVWTEFGLRPPTNANDEGGYQVFDAEAAARLIKRLEETKGVDIIFAPRVTTRSGRQTQVKSVEVQTIATGNTGDQVHTEPMEFGPVLDVIPTFINEGGTLQLSAIGSVTQFLGYDDAGAFANQVTGRLEEASVVPRVVLRQIQAEVHLSPGQVLVMTGGYSPGAITKSEGNIEQGEPKGLIVIVDAREIDKAGNTVNP